MKDSTLRSIQIVLMYIVVMAVAVIILVAIVALIGQVAFIGPFKSHGATREFIKYFQPVVLIVFFGAGIPFIVLSFIKGIPTNPMTFTTLNSPFDSTEALHAYMKTALLKDSYHDEVILRGDGGLEQSMCYKTTLSRTYVFGIVDVPVLNQISKASLEELTNEYMDHHLEKLTKDVYLTLLVCVDIGSKDYTNLVRRYGQSPGRYFVNVGFNFDKHTMSFLSKIDGFAAGKRKRLLKDFLAMLPEPEKYANLNKLEESKKHKVINESEHPLQP